jgi:hypothetical protein
VGRRRARLRGHRLGRDVDTRAHTAYRRTAAGGVSDAGGHQPIDPHRDPTADHPFDGCVPPAPSRMWVPRTPFDACRASSSAFTSAHREVHARYQIASVWQGAHGPSAGVPSVGLERQPAKRRVRIRAAVHRAGRDGGRDQLTADHCWPPIRQSAVAWRAAVAERAIDAAGVRCSAGHTP